MTASTLVAPVSVDDDRLRELVWAALATVRDPELDQSITELTFISGLEVADGHVAVTLRLPTYFCAPNFAYLMVADAYDAVAAVPGIGHTDVQLLDHFASAEINAGVAERAGFSGSFPGQTDDELGELRLTFQRKAYLASLERACKQLLDKDWDVAELHAAQLFDLPYGPERSALLRRRDDIGLSALPDDYLMVDDHGVRMPEAEVGPRLRFAKAVRVSIDGNGTMCRGLLKVRYGTATEPGTLSGVSRLPISTAGAQ